MSKANMRTNVAVKTSAPTGTNATILRQIIELENKPIFELRKIYDDIMPQKCQQNSTTEFLRARIAYRLQELSFGALNEKAKEELLKISGGVLGNTAKQSSIELMPSTKICREWNEVLYEVEVLKDGFAYCGHKFRSLSSIATKITGTKWNGLKFFKLKPHLNTN